MPGTPFRTGNRRMPTAKINQQIADEIRAEVRQGKTQGQIARERGLSVNQVGKIARGEAWNSSGSPTDLPPVPSAEESLAKMLEMFPSNPVYAKEYEAEFKPEVESSLPVLAPVPVPPHLNPLLDKLITDINGAMKGEKLLDELMKDDSPVNPKQKGD